MKTVYRWDVKDLVKGEKPVMAVIKREGEYQIVSAGEMTLSEWMDEKNQVFFVEEDEKDDE